MKRRQSKRSRAQSRMWRAWVTAALLTTPMTVNVASPDGAAATTWRVAARGATASSQMGTRSQSTSPLTDIPVANKGRFSPARRGCNFLPASALARGAHPSPLPLGRCRVLEIGDSLGDDLGFGLYKELGHTPGLSLLVTDKSSTGLSASWFYNWPQHFKKFLAQDRPNLVVI